MVAGLSINLSLQFPHRKARGLHEFHWFRGSFGFSCWFQRPGWNSSNRCFAPPSLILRDRFGRDLMVSWDENSVGEIMLFGFWIPVRQLQWSPPLFLLFLEFGGSTSPTTDIIFYNRRRSSTIRLRHGHSSTIFAQTLSSKSKPGGSCSTLWATFASSESASITPGSCFKPIIIRRSSTQKFRTFWFVAWLFLPGMWHSCFAIGTRLCSSSSGGRLEIWISDIYWLFSLRLQPLDQLDRNEQWVWSIDWSYRQFNFSWIFIRLSDYYVLLS